MKNKTLLAYSALAGTLALSVAQAQAQQQQAQKPASIEEIVVSGSRVITNGLAAPTPVTVVGVDQIKDNTPSDLYQGLTQMPVFAGSSSPATASFGTTGSNVGAGLANLRGLGANRTLILLDGHRVVPSSDSGSPDISLFPSALVQRVDVVTGGASAAYGSDAVTGVVNFVLDTKFDGFKADVNGSVTSQGDKPGYDASFVWGTGFANDKGHFILSSEYNNSAGLISCDRESSCAGYAVVANGTVTAATATAANPLRVLASDVKSSRMAIGGLIYSGQGVLSNIGFGPGGQPVPFIPGALFNPTTMVGGSGNDGGDYVTLYAARQQYSVFTNVSYDITDNISAFVEGSIGHTGIDDPSFLARDAPSTEQYTIFSGNPYIPASIQQIMTANKIASFGLGRLDLDFANQPIKGDFSDATPSPMEYTSKNDMRRIETGFNAKLGGSWTADGTLNYGWNRVISETPNDPILEREYLASDAVVNPATGAPICRVKLNNPTSTDPKVANCVPVDLFGNGSPSSAALNYILGTSFAQRINTQTVVDVAVRGEPFSTWAGPVSFGIGGTYRHEHLNQTSDPISGGNITSTPALDPAIPSSDVGRFGGFRLTNTPILHGTINVKEAFTEVLVPLAKNMNFANSLDLNAAVRYVDYNTSGGVVPWKVGLVYEPVDGVRLRATRSRDIRAGDMNELFTTASPTGLTVTDPFRNNVQSSSGTAVAEGNPNVLPEKADTSTVGVTYEPGFLPGFATSLDYYNIEIDNAITTLSAQTIVTQCFQGNTSVCGLIVRDPSTQTIIEVFTPTLNAAALKSAGIDYEASYKMPVSSLVSSWDGDLTFRLLATHVWNQSTATSGSPFVNNVAGNIGGGGPPKWKGNLSVNYTGGPLTVVWAERYIGSGWFDTSEKADPTNISPIDNHIQAIWYTNLTAHYRLGDLQDKDLYFTVNNLFDQDPPKTGSFSTAGTLTIGRDLYDYVGRSFTVGVRIKL